MAFIENYGYCDDTIPAVMNIDLSLTKPCDSPKWSKMNQINSSTHHRASPKSILSGDYYQLNDVNFLLRTLIDYQ